MRGDGFALLSRHDRVTDTATTQLRQPSRHDADTLREDMAPHGLGPGRTTVFAVYVSVL